MYGTICALINPCACYGKNIKGIFLKQEIYEMPLFD
jgi:hypothetical protein